MVKLNYLFLAFLVISLLGACQGGTTMTPKSSHPVGEAFQGTYRVGFASGDIGDLKLSGGEYAFTSLVPLDQIPPDAIDRLFFVRNPKGRYSVEYQAPVSESTLLEDLKGFTFLTLIRFSTSPGTNEVAPGPNRWSTDNIFYIATDSERKLLLFHSVISELERWSLSKPWE